MTVTRMVVKEMVMMTVGMMVGDKEQLVIGT